MKWLLGRSSKNNVVPDNPATDSDAGETLNCVVTSDSVNTDTAKAGSTHFPAEYPPIAQLLIVSMHP